MDELGLFILKKVNQVFIQSFQRPPLDTAGAEENGYR